MSQPTVCACYQVGREPEYLARSLAVMLNYPWITSAVILHTYQEGSPKQHGKIQEFYQDLGCGFDKQPEAGGFDEVAAYNRSLELGRATGCDWLLLIHADDFFLPGTYDHIQIADRCQKDVVFFEYFHFYSPTQYIVNEKAMKTMSPRSPPNMHDPHIRTIRSASSVQWGLNRNEEARAKWQNRTAHCTPGGWTWPRAMCVPGMFHIHTRHMFDPKRAQWLAKKPNPADMLVTVPAGINIFPQVYLDEYVPMPEGPITGTPVRQ